MSFRSEERGTAVVWIIAILGLAMFGLFYAMVDPFIEEMLAQGVSSGIPTEQQNIQSIVWTLFPLAALGTFVLWGITKNQRTQEFQ